MESAILKKEVVHPIALPWRFSLCESEGGMDLIGWFERAEWWEIALVSILLNLSTVTNSVVLFRLLVRERAVSAQVRRPNGRDRSLTASTTFVNAAAVLPPWWLWSRGTIELASPSLRIVLEVLYLTVAIDTAMYALHRISHHGVLFRWFHQVHHSDDRPPSELTLFVMHPVEAAGFSTVMIALMLLWPVSVPAIAVFFGLNLVVGTVAHVPLVTPGRWENILGGSRLHQVHHEETNANFGFFTQVWDRALGTFR